MAVNEGIMALGSWSLTLREDTPLSILNKLRYYGHVVIHSSRQFHPEMIGDSLLKSARYTGVLRARQFTGAQAGASASTDGSNSILQSGTSIPDSNLFGGSGMEFWLGDEDDKGAVIEGVISTTTELDDDGNVKYDFDGNPIVDYHATGKVLQGVLFTEGVRELLPYSGAITEGTFHPVTGAWSGMYVYTTSRRALSDFVSYFSNDYGEAEWRVNPDGSLDAGTIDQLYVTQPRAILSRKSNGQDLHLRGLNGDAQTDEDVEDFSTRVIVIAEGMGDSVATGAADINPDLNVYKDIHGNKLVMTRMVSQSGTDATNADASATLQLNRFLKPRTAISLSSDEIDLRGTFAVGDYIWAYDPQSGLIDTNNETIFRGERIYPVRIRVSELSWPITEGMGVAYRSQEGDWLDLSDYVVWEDASNVNLIVGANPRSLLPDGDAESVGSRPKPDSSIPDIVEWVLPFGLSSYQSLTGVTRSQVALAWKRPLNTDGTAILDGDHYEIRYRNSGHQILPVTWQYLGQSAAQWKDLVQWDGILPAVEGPWTYTAVGFDQEQFLISDLTPGVPYDVEIRAVDSASPPNYGTWNDPVTFETQSDPYPPSQPAPPEVASSLIAVQVTHYLGKSSGGTFNLEADLHHLEVHAAFESTYTPNDSTLLGKMPCNIGSLLSGVPIVATFQISLTDEIWIKVIAVDEAGNRSNGSTGAQSSADLIDDQHITNLSVSKVIAGTIQADWLIGGRIETAHTGSRAGMNAFGFYAYDQYNNQTFQVDANTGSVYMVGVLDTAANGSRVRIAPADPTHVLQAPGMYLWAVGSDNPGLIYSVPEGNGANPSSVAVTSSLDITTNQVGSLYCRDDRVYMGMRSYQAPDFAHPHGAFVENGSYFAARMQGTEIASVGQVNADDSISFDGGFFQANKTDYAQNNNKAVSVQGFQNGPNGTQTRWAMDYTGSIEHSGRWLALVASPDMGTFIGTVTPSGSSGGVNVSFGATYVDKHAGLACGVSVAIAYVSCSSTAVAIGYQANSASVCELFVFGLNR